MFRSYGLRLGYKNVKGARSATKSTSKSQTSFVLGYLSRNDCQRGRSVKCKCVFWLSNWTNWRLGLPQKKSRPPASGGKITGSEQFKVNSEILAYGTVNFGTRTGHAYLVDPKHLLFNLSRYKFVSKMLAGMDNVLEVGCGDGFGSALVRQTVSKLTATDLDARFVEQTSKCHPYASKIKFLAHNLIDGPVPGKFDGAFCLDVLEHIDQKLEHQFVANLAASLRTNAVCIFGMPSLESQIYASELSKLGHVNCKTAPELRSCMSSHFRNVFIFSMNDEVLHTGFHPMSHYLFALCVSPRRTIRRKQS